MPNMHLMVVPLSTPLQLYRSNRAIESQRHTTRNANTPCNIPSHCENATDQCAECSCSMPASLAIDPKITAGLAHGRANAVGETTPTMICFFFKDGNGNHGIMR